MLGLAVLFPLIGAKLVGDAVSGLSSWSRREARVPQSFTGEPGPSGMPIRYQTTKKSVHSTDRITT